MQRLIFSLATALFLIFPTTVQAQHQFGRGFYQPHHNNWQKNNSQQWLCADGDTVIHDEQILTYNLCVGVSTCGYVQSRGGTCDYIGWDQNARTHYTRSINNSSSNWNNRRYNPGWSNNQHRRNPARMWNNNVRCVYQDNHVRILCN